MTHNTKHEWVAGLIFILFLNVTIVFTTVVLFFWMHAAKAEEPHNHSLMDPRVDRFLQFWKQPDPRGKRVASCCNNRDCDEVETRPANGGVEFKSRVTGQWTPIPPRVLEQNQPDTEWSPNGKAWVCQSRVQMHVICATLGDPGI